MAFISSICGFSTFRAFAPAIAARSSTFTPVIPQVQRCRLTTSTKVTMQYGGEENGNKLFVGNLSWGLSDDDLYEAFQNFGVITEARIITDRESGRSRGFGFVTFADAGNARQAAEAMNGKDMDGRALTVNVAQPRESRGGFSGGGRGGYGERRGGGGRGGFRGRRNYDDE